MRILLDENLPVDLASELVGRDVATVSGLGWQGISNGELLRRAQGTVEVLVTMDRILEFQRTIPSLDLCVVLALASSNRMAHLRPIIPALLEAIETGGQAHF